MPYSIEFLEDRDVPIQGVVSGGKLNYYNTRTKELSFLRDWEDGESSRGSGGRSDLSISNARFGPIVDATRNRSRYIWIHENDNRFGVSDLDNFERPDYFAPYYSIGSLFGYVDRRRLFFRAPDNSEPAHCEMAFGLSAHYPSPNSQGRNLTVDIVLIPAISGFTRTITGSVFLIWI